MENCCATRPNFGRPVCVDDFGTITTMLLVPLRDSSGAPYYTSLDSTYEYLKSLFYYQNPADRVYGFPQLENVEYAIADSLKEEGASGRKSFLRNGIISITAETWDKDATAVIKGKMSQLRCADWGIFFVTDKNLLVGSKINYDTHLGYILAPIKIDSQSIDPKFMFKTNTTTQKVMLTFDLDRNFDDSTYYAISGDELWSTADETVKTIDFNDVPKIIDCDLSLYTLATTTQAHIAINDDYRQGSRNVNNTDAGNVTGLTVDDFLVTNVTDLTTITPTSVVEEPTGVYIITYSGAQTSGDKMKVDLVIADTNPVNYNGSITYLIP